MVCDGSRSRNRVLEQDPWPSSTGRLSSAPPPAWHDRRLRCFPQGRGFLAPEIPKSLLEIPAMTPGPRRGPLEGIGRGSRNRDNRAPCLAPGNPDAGGLSRRAGRVARAVLHGEPRSLRYLPGAENARSLGRPRSDAHLSPAPSRAHGVLSDPRGSFRDVCGDLRGALRTPQRTPETGRDSDGRGLSGLWPALQWVCPDPVPELWRRALAGVFVPDTQLLSQLSGQTRGAVRREADRRDLFGEKLTEEIARPVVHRHLVFTIPRALRGLFARERRLLGLLSRCAYEAVRRAYGAYLEDRTVVPGFVASIQTFGSFAANFHPHIHALVTQGAFKRDGEFLPVGTVNTDAIEELFRRLVLTRLSRAERLSEEFRDNLLGWVHSGFSVYAGPRIYPTEPEHLERLGRYIVRVPMPQKDVRLTPEGQVRVATPPDPRTGKTELRLDPLD